MSQISLTHFSLKNDEKAYVKKSKNAFFDIGGLKKSDYQDPDEVKKNSFSTDR